MSCRREKEEEMLVDVADVTVGGTSEAIPRKDI
jgi:hypothetical protein